MNTVSENELKNNLISYARTQIRQRIKILASNKTLDNQAIDYNHFKAIIRYSDYKSVSNFCDVVIDRLICANNHTESFVDSIIVELFKEIDTQYVNKLVDRLFSIQQKETAKPPMIDNFPTLTQYIWYKPQSKSEVDVLMTYYKYIYLDKDVVGKWILIIKPHNEAPVCFTMENLRQDILLFEPSIFETNIDKKS